MICGVDSAYPPGHTGLVSAKAAGIKVWCGYFSGPNVLHGWSQADFERVRDVGLSTLAYCSGWADPTAMRVQSQAWGVPICLDVEGGIRGNGAWVQAWLNASGAGLYGNAPVFSGHRAAFYVLAAYLGFDPQRTWSGTPPGHPCGWQWRGSHTAFGSTVDSAWFDDAFATLGLTAGAQTGTQEAFMPALTDAQQLDIYNDIQAIRGSNAIRFALQQADLEKLLAEIKTAITNLTVPTPTIDFTAVLTQIADLKAHPVVASDPTLAAKIDALAQPINALGKHLGVGTP